MFINYKLRKWLVDDTSVHKKSVIFMSPFFFCDKETSYFYIKSSLIWRSFIFLFNTMLPKNLFPFNTPLLNLQFYTMYLFNTN